MWSRVGARELVGPPTFFAAFRTRLGARTRLAECHREALADAFVADIAQHGPAGVVALAVSHADCEDLADRIRGRLREGGHLRGPEVAGPAWGSGERRYAAGDRLLVHGTLRTDGAPMHNGSVVTVTGVGPDGLRAVDAVGRIVTLPPVFVGGRRPDDSPNCSHAWARTVDGVQVASCEQRLEDLRPELGRRLQWDVEHEFPDSRLRAVDRELAKLGHSLDHSRSRETSLFRRAPGVKQPAWLDRLPEIARPPLPGRDAGPDVGLGL